MRAYQLPKAAGIDALVKVDLPMPKPGPRQVLVKVAACSLNFRDLAIALGSYRMPVKPSLIPLSDGAGEVVDVGAGVTRVKAGDRVAGCFFQRWTGGPIPADSHTSALGGGLDGMLAEYAVLEEDGVVKLPAHLSYEEAATLPCAAVTAWHALVEHARIVAGQTVLVQGTGGVSIFALQFARLMGAQVIVTSSSDEKLARARELGADAAVNHATDDVVAAVREATGGHGADVVVEHVGEATWKTSLQVAATGGRIAVCGATSGPNPPANLHRIWWKQLTVLGSTMGTQEDFRAVYDLVASGRAKPVVDRVFPLAEAASAHEHLESGRQLGKVVLRIPD
jgi:NADPH:quinone reductase-like Zn-dependent oxidoreductase